MEADRDYRPIETKLILPRRARTWRTGMSMTDFMPGMPRIVVSVMAPEFRVCFTLTPPRLLSKPRRRRLFHPASGHQRPEAPPNATSCLFQLTDVTCRGSFTARRRSASAQSGVQADAGLSLAVENQPCHCRARALVRLFPRSRSEAATDRILIDNLIGSPVGSQSDCPEKISPSSYGLPGRCR